MALHNGNNVQGPSRAKSATTPVRLSVCHVYKGTRRSSCMDTGSGAGSVVLAVPVLPQQCPPVPPAPATCPSEAVRSISLLRGAAAGCSRVHTRAWLCLALHPRCPHRARRLPRGCAPASALSTPAGARSRPGRGGCGAWGAIFLTAFRLYIWGDCLKRCC